MRKKGIFFVAPLLTLLSLVGCGETTQQEWSRTVNQFTGSSYKITVYSGGKAVKKYTCRNCYPKAEESGQGYYWFDGGKQFKVMGTVIVEEQ